MPVSLWFLRFINKMFCCKTQSLSYLVMLLHHTCINLIVLFFQHRAPIVVFIKIRHSKSTNPTISRALVKKRGQTSRHNDFYYLHNFVTSKWWISINQALDKLYKASMAKHEQYGQRTYLVGVVFVIESTKVYEFSTKCLIRVISNFQMAWDRLCNFPFIGRTLTIQMTLNNNFLCNVLLIIQKP